MIELVERIGSDIDITAYMVSPYTPPPPEPSMSLHRATACEREFEDLFRQSLCERPVMSLVDWKNGFAELESKVTLDTISCLSEDGVESARTPGTSSGEPVPGQSSNMSQIKFPKLAIHVSESRISDDPRQRVTDKRATSTL